MIDLIKRVAIVGANLAGGRAAEVLRENGFGGSIILIGEEPWRPYQRPPLSKELLWGGGALPAGFYLRDEGWYESQKIELRLGERVEKIAAPAGKLLLASGQEVAADRVLLATGSRARRLPLAGASARNVHHLRTKNDAEALAQRLQRGARIVVVGMGVIGAEVAASASKAGCDVLSIEPSPTAMMRTLGSTMGKWLARIHRDRGVTCRFGTAVERLIVEDDLARALVLSDGHIVDCDAIVVGIGVEPAVELATSAGLVVDNGIVVDDSGATSNPFIYAAGDVANQPGFFGGRVRMETFENAALQAERAALAMIGVAGAPIQPCWFWSDQYESNIQVLGRVQDGMTQIVRGNIDGGEFAIFYLHDQLLQGVVTVNRGGDMAVAKRILRAGMKLDPGDLGNASVPLRALL